MHAVSQRMERLALRWQKEAEQIGMRIGELTILYRQLERKFGELPNAAVERLERADEDQLLAWSDRIFTATALDDVFDESSTS